LPIEYLVQACKADNVLSGGELEVTFPFPSWFHPCVLATPHQQYWMPPALDLGTIIASGSGAYHYQTDKLGCDRFLVDVVLDRYSASGINPPDQPLGPLQVIILADAYDLPSSASFGGVTPTTQEDCKRYQLFATFYRRLYQETSFTLVKDYSHLHTTLDSAGDCQPIGSPGITVNTPTVGFDTFRVAVYCILRNTAQQVKVFFGEGPPA
jgi:hypothetical protein